MHNYFIIILIIIIVIAAPAEYASTLLYSDWLFLHGIFLNGFSDLLKNIWKKNYRFSIRNWYCSGIVLYTGLSLHSDRFQSFLGILFLTFQMVWCTGKKSKKIANRTTIPGGGHITGRAPLILKSLLMLCWLSHSTMTSVLGWQYHAGYRSRETRWEATLRRRYCRLCKGLFRYLFLSNGVLVLNFWIILREIVDYFSSYLVLRVFLQLSPGTSFSEFLISF